MRLISILGIAILALSIGACESEQAATQSKPDAYRQSNHQNVQHAAWLSTRLPSATVAYLRVPKIWGMLATPKDDALHPALSDPALQRQLRQLRSAVRKQLDANIPAQMAPVMDLLFEFDNAPLELAILSPVDGSMVPNVLVGTTVKGLDSKAMAAWLEALAAADDQIRLFAALDDQGDATLMGGPLPIYLHFNAGNGRLWMLSGLSASEKLLADYRSLADAAILTDLNDLEQRFDSTGQGLAIWAKPQQVWPMLVPLLDPLQVSSVELAGIHQANFLWIGNANKGGHSELRLELGMGQQGFREFVPLVQQQSTVTTAGAPSLVVRVALPSAAELQAIIDRALELSVDGRIVRDQISEVRQQFKQLAGFEIDDLFDAVGPDLLTISDQAGLWMAVRIRDRAALERVLAALATASGTQPGVQTVAGLEINDWHLPSLFGALSSLAAEEEQAMDPQMALFNRLKTHIYWVEDGDYLILANLPQVLMDRAQADHALRLDQWLQRGHGIDWQQAVFAAIKSSEKSARNVFRGYLQGLLILGDLAETEIDLLAIPTARQLGLPERGRFAFQFDSGPDRMVFSLQYGHSPLDALFNGDFMTTSAMVGILSAIAIPAYTDYTLRARVAEDLNLAAHLKLAISEEYLSQGAYPNRELAAEILQTRQVGGQASFEIEADTGVILIQFSDPQLQDLAVQLSPEPEGSDRVIWHCQVNSGPARFLPSNCR